jgi:hypothetical protein
MPTMEEIRLALGKMDKSSDKPLIESSNIINENVNPNPFSEKLFAPVEQLENKIQDRDKIIESLKNESIVLKNQVSRVEEEKSTILEELEKSRWLESKVALATKKVYEDKVKSIINENVDSKLIHVLTAVARRKQGNQQLNWGNWLKIPENRYLYEVNEDIAKKIFEDTNALIPKKRTRGGGAVTEKNYSISFTGNSTGATRTYVKTDFNPDDYDLNLGFTVSYWVRPDEVGNTMFAFGRKHSNNQRFTFGINRKRQSYFGVGSNTGVKAWVNMDTPVEESLLVEDGSYWNLKTDGTWYHIIVTYDDRTDTSSGTDRKVYVNGVLRQTDTFNWSSTGGGTSGMMFGARNLSGDYNNGWACGLDEVAIYDTAKDSDWVTSTFNSGTPNDLTGDSGLVGYWKFNEGSGTTIKDHSGNGNHGTFGAISGNTTAYPTWSTDTPQI